MNEGASTESDDDEAEARKDAEYMQKIEAEAAERKKLEDSLNKNKELTQKMEEVTEEFDRYKLLYNAENTCYDDDKPSEQEISVKPSKKGLQQPIIQASGVCLACARKDETVAILAAERKKCTDELSEVTEKLEQADKTLASQRHIYLNTPS